MARVNSVRSIDASSRHTFFLSIERTINDKSVPRLLTRIMELLPVALPAGMAVFSIVAVLLLLTDQLRNIYIWPAGCSAALITMVIISRYYPRIRYRNNEWLLCNIIVLVGVICWVIGNAVLSGQHLITNRDPGTYANAALWLVRHDSLRMTATAIFDKVPGVSPESPGFSYDASGHYLLAQGQHLLPALLGLAGRVVGTTHIFQFNVIFGAFALLALFGCASRLVRPFWAMIATGIIACTMPFIYFSRDTYTEPLAVAFNFGGLSLLGHAIKSKSVPMWLISGIVLGAGTLTRIDGYLTIVCMLGFSVILLATEPLRGRIKALKCSLVFYLGMGIPAVIGWLDVSRLSEDYYHNTRPEFYPVIIALIAAVMVGAVIVGISWSSDKAMRQLDRITKPWLGQGAIVAVLVSVLLLASRPLWYRGYDHMVGGTVIRNFSELSLQWVSWYTGPFIGLFGALGLGLALRKLFLRRELFLTAVLSVVVCTSAVYLIRPSISPDQIWATRRLIPVVIPGIVLFGVAALEYLQVHLLPPKAWRPVYISLAALGLLVDPLITTRHLLLSHDTALMQPMRAVCCSIPHSSAILWLGTARSIWYSRLTACVAYHPKVTVITFPRIKQQVSRC